MLSRGASVPASVPRRARTHLSEWRSRSRFYCTTGPRSFGHTVPALTVTLTAFRPCSGRSSARSNPRIQRHRTHETHFVPRKAQGPILCEMSFSQKHLGTPQPAAGLILTLARNHSLLRERCCLWTMVRMWADGERWGCLRDTERIAKLGIRLSARVTPGASCLLDQAERGLPLKRVKGGLRS